MSTAAERREIYSTRRWVRLRARLLAASDYRCSECGARRLRGLQLHHILPVRSGGSAWDPANLQILCRTCHRRKHDYTPRPRRRDVWMAAFERAKAMHAEPESN